MKHTGHMGSQHWVLLPSWPGFCSCAYTFLPWTFFSVTVTLVCQRQTAHLPSVPGGDVLPGVIITLRRMQNRHAGKTPVQGQLNDQGTGEFPQKRLRELEMFSLE